jgi:glycosyltransferase involved in cell wall biosynthesis
MNNRKIVFIKQAVGYLEIDIINSFANRYKEVNLLTGSIRVQNTILNKSVRVSKIAKYDRGNTFRKAISWIWGTIQIYFLLLFKFRKHEKVFFTVPPTAYLLASLFRSKFTIVMLDLYPDALTTYGFSPKGLLFRWWARMNRQLFSRAFKLITLTQGMKERILFYAPDAEVKVIPNWSAFSGLVPVKRLENKLREQLALQDKFIVQYSGNIGFTHKVEVLVEVADFLSTYDDIVFLIIGRGKRTSDIQSMIQKKSLSNCHLLPFRKDDELFDSLCAADLAVITLDDSAPNISMPSKAYNILAAGTPVMGIASSNSSIADLVTKHQVGRVFSGGDIKGMSEFILELKKNPTLCAQLSYRSLEASQYYTSANAEKYVEVYSE